jgi:predicted RNA-binding protein YlxR (DUF448 family)
MNEMSVIEARVERPRPHRSDAAIRRCIVSGDTLPRERLIRFVIGPDDVVVPDLSERLPGRGLWLTGHHDIVSQACVSGAFRRAARRAVSPLVGPHGEDLSALVDGQLAQRCLDAIGLARRAGRLVVGFDQVRAGLKGMASDAGQSRGAAILLTAQDAAADGRDKLTALANRIAEGGAEITRLALFDAKTLGSAVGRDQVVHALVENDAAGKRLHAAIRRLAVYRGVTLFAEDGGAGWVPSDVVDMD